MKYLFLILILCASSPTLSTQPSLLASVERIEAGATATPPVEKKKLKKKRLKKRFKKPNRLKKTNKNRIKDIILFNLIGASSFFVIFSVVTLLTINNIISIIFIISAGVSLFFALILLTIFLIYIAVKNRNQKKKTILKKEDQVLREEVAYLDPKKVALYLSLNEKLTAAAIRKNNLIRTKKEQSAKEWAAAKLEIRDLDATINRTKAQIKELRTQNKTMQVRRERR